MIFLDNSALIWLSLPNPRGGGGNFLFSTQGGGGGGGGVGGGGGGGGGAPPPPPKKMISLLWLFYPSAPEKANQCIFKLFIVKKISRLQ